MLDKELFYKNSLNLTDQEISELEIKKASRVVVLTGENRVILIKEFNGLHSLPGGTVEGNETIYENLYRECMEETGYNIKIISELGYVKIVKKNHVSINFGFLVKSIGNQFELNLTDEEKELGHKLEEYDLDEAIKVLESDFENYGKIDHRSLSILKEAKNYLNNIK